MPRRRTPWMWRRSLKASLVDLGGAPPTSVVTSTAMALTPAGQNFAERDTLVCQLHKIGINTCDNSLRGSYMQLFLSWSGPRSKAVADALASWLPQAIHAVQPWMSSEL